MATVLVVDDDTSIRETLRIVMEDAGHAVIEASDGAQALAELRAERDRLVVLLDLVMPAMDGQSVLEAVASDVALRKRHAYIVLTAGGDALVSTIKPYLGSVPVQVVHKPFDIDELTAAIDLAVTQGGSSPQA
jgi:two-component system chemotaxis response regulator CheY